VARAVVFDLWHTLAIWPEEKSAEVRRIWSSALETPVEQVEELWLGDTLFRLRETGPIAAAIEALHEALGTKADVREIVARRLELTREALVPVDGALSTLRLLRERGVKTGLVSNCSEEVALVWDETPFAGLLDVAIFSATARCMKPEPEIYELALAQLGVEASDALFVGDGANDELRGARDVGMTPVLALLDGAPRSAAGDGWDGLGVTAIPQVLDLVS
jgi:HAD superfamily hydrolase (TIGR01509 family)